MAKELLVNVSRGEEVRVALVEDARLEEIYLERDSAASNVGNIYLGKVTNVEGSIQAAFVDFGYGRNGFLHVQDLHPDYFPDGGRWENMTERVGKKIGRRDRPPIQDCLRRGDHIIVQIIKEGIGTKGPTLTSYPSIPGRFLVMMPGVAQMGVSKNIEDETERRRLRKILDGLKPPKDVGFIIRTAGMGKTKAELERDFKYLTRLYEQIEHHRKHARPPTLLYSEGDLVTRTVRDVWTPDIDRVICDDPETALRIKQFFKLLMPRTKVDVQLYQGHVPLFHAAGVEAEIETMFSRHVPLPSGGSLVIDSTEAVVAIDVNSGKFREHSDAEETAFRTDMEAADEICRQLRLRDLGGVVIVDFIDLRYARHRQALFDKLTELFKRDKAKSRHLEMNEFGIICITRQRMRPDLKKSVYMPCPWSKGTGFIKTPESMALDVMRRLRVAAADERVRRISVGLYPSVALHVLNSKRQALADLERASETPITLRPDESLAADEVALELFDERDGQVVIEALQSLNVEEPDSGGRRKRRRRRRKDEEPQAKGGKDEGWTDEAGLIELPDLLPLGELKLDEVERLVDEVEAEVGAAREAASRDPQKVILEALRSGSLYEDESDATEDKVPAKRAKGGVEAQETEEEGGHRRKRRRRRGRRDEQDESRMEPRQEPREHATLDEEPQEAQAKVVEEPAETEAEAEAPTQAQPVQEGEERSGRRRRRRRRRGRGEREAAAESANGDAKAPRDGDQRATKEQRAEQNEAESPDDLLDRNLNGNRVDMQTHTMRRDPFVGGDSDEADHGEHGSRRRRRRRKGRGLRGHTLFGHTGGIEAEAPPSERLKQTGLSDEALDARINGNRIDAGSKKPVGVYRESEDEDDGPAETSLSPTETARRGESPRDEPARDESAREDGERGGRKRRRRRRRGRGGASAEDQAPPTPQVEEASGEASKQASDAAETVEQPVADVAEDVTAEDTEAPVELSAEAEVQEPVDEAAEADSEPEPEPAKPTRKRAKKAAKAPAKKAPKKAAKKVAKKAPKKTTRKKAVKASAE